MRRKRTREENIELLKLRQESLLVGMQVERDRQKRDEFRGPFTVAELLRVLRIGRTTLYRKMKEDPSNYRKTPGKEYFVHHSLLPNK